MAKKRKKKQASKSWIIILLILLIAILMYIPLQPEEPVEEPPVKNITEPEPTGIKKGDLIKINFVLSLEDGTVVDTNNVTLAEKWNLSNYVKGPYSLFVGKSGKVKGFDDALVGLTKGQTAQKIIGPTEKVLFINNSRREKIVRREAIPRNQKFPLKTYENFFGKPAFVGDVIFNPELVFKYQVINITEKNAYAKILLYEGDELTLPGNNWKSQVMEVGKRMITVIHNPKENTTFDTNFGTAYITVEERTFYINHEPELGRKLSESVDIGQFFQPIVAFEIIEIGDTWFLLRRTNYLLQEKLTFDVEILEIQEIE